MDPSTVQYAGAGSTAAVHRGSESEIAETGSPIADGAMAAPSFADVQSDSVIVLRSPMSGKEAGCGGGGVEG